jgi:hypothetical protein
LQLRTTMYVSDGVILYKLSSVTCFAYDMSTVSVLCLTLLRFSKLQSCVEMHVYVMMLCFTIIYI